jgi:hypothetical protein
MQVICAATITVPASRLTPGDAWLGSRDRGHDVRGFFQRSMSDDRRDVTPDTDGARTFRRRGRRQGRYVDASSSSHLSSV